MARFSELPTRRELVNTRESSSTSDDDSSESEDVNFTSRLNEAVNKSVRNSKANAVSGNAGKRNSGNAEESHDDDDDDDDGDEEEHDEEEGRNKQDHNKESPLRRSSRILKLQSKPKKQKYGYAECDEPENAPRSPPRRKKRRGAAIKRKPNSPRAGARPTGKQKDNETQDVQPQPARFPAAGKPRPPHHDRPNPRQLQQQQEPGPAPRYNEKQQQPQQQYPQEKEAVPAPRCNAKQQQPQQRHPQQQPQQHPQQQPQQRHPQQQQQRRPEPQQWVPLRQATPVPEHRNPPERPVPQVDISSGQAVYRGQRLKLSRDVSCPEPYCNLSFCSLLTLDLHQNFHAKYKFTCKLCFKCFKTMEGVGEHFLMYHPQESPGNNNVAKSQAIPIRTPQVEVSHAPVEPVPAPSRTYPTNPVYSAPANNRPQVPRPQERAAAPKQPTLKRQNLPNPQSPLRVRPPASPLHPNRERSSVTPARSEVSTAAQPSSNLRCRVCSQSFGNFVRLEAHIGQYHRDLLIHKCANCKSKFASKQYFHYHKKTCK